MLLNGSEAASEEFDAPTEQLRNHDFRNSRITNSAERVMSFLCLHPPHDAGAFFTSPTENLSNLRNLRSICLAFPIFLLIFAPTLLVRKGVGSILNGKGRLRTLSST